MFMLYERGCKSMKLYRTDLAMERTVHPEGPGEGIRLEEQKLGAMTTTWVRVETEDAARRIGKARGVYWTLHHPALPSLGPQERLPVAREIGNVLTRMLPPSGDVLVLGLGNRRMTADALGSRVADRVLVTRHMKEGSFRPVSAVAPGVLGVTGIESAELTRALAEHIKPAAIIAVDALAAMDTEHICTTVQLTDTGIRPGSGVGNHRAGITQEAMGVPVIALGIPMVVYASTIIRDGLRHILADEEGENADAMAEKLAENALEDFVVTPRAIDELVDGLADVLALALNTATQPQCTMEELAYYLH